MARLGEHGCHVYCVHGRPAELCGFFQRSDVIEPSIAVGGHPGGVIAAPVAVVHFLDDDSFGEAVLMDITAWKAQKSVPNLATGEENEK